MLARIKQWHIRFDTLTAFIAAGLILVMTLWGTADVLGRYLFNKPLMGTYEAMRFIMGGVAFFTFAYVQYMRGHITVPIIQERLPAKGAAMLDFIFLIAVLATFAFIAWSGALDTISSWQHGDVTHGLVEWPEAPAKMVVPIGCGLLCLRIFSQICGTIATFFRSNRNHGGT